MNTKGKRYNAQDNLSNSNNSTNSQNQQCMSGHIDNELETMLKYIETGVPSDDYTRSLEREVQVIRDNRKWRREYMTLEMKYKEIEKEAIKLGKELGKNKILCEKVCRKLQKQKSVEQIIDELEAEDKEVDLIKATCAVAEELEYDVDAIYDKLFPDD